LIAILDRRSDADLTAWSEVWVEQPGRPVITAEITEDADGALSALALRQHDPRERGRVWPQRLDVLLAYDNETLSVPIDLVGSATPSGDWIGRARPNFVLPNGSGLEYGHFRLDSHSLDCLTRNLPDIQEPLVRGIAWIALWDAVLEGGVTPQVWMDLLLRGLETETVEQNVQRILGYLGTTFWRLRTQSERLELSESLEKTLWSGIESAVSPTLAGTYFRAWRGIVLSPEGCNAYSGPGTSR